MPTDKIHISGLTPVVRKEGESPRSFGQRRQQQIREWYDDGYSIGEILDEHDVSRSYVLDTLGFATDYYDWAPPKSILRGPFPTRAEALKEAPLISEQPRRMQPEQAVARAIQFWRWFSAGLSLKEIGDRHGLSRERVRTVLLKYNFPIEAYAPRWKSGKPPRYPLIYGDGEELQEPRERPVPRWTREPDEDVVHEAAQ